MIETPGFYDLLLVAISIPMIVAIISAALFTVPTTYLLGAGSLPASGLVGYALFVDPPE